MLLKFEQSCFIFSAGRWGTGLACKPPTFWPWFPTKPPQLHACSGPANKENIFTNWKKWWKLKINLPMATAFDYHKEQKCHSSVLLISNWRDSSRICPISAHWDHDENLAKCSSWFEQLDTSPRHPDWTILSWTWDNAKDTCMGVPDEFQSWSFWVERVRLER